MNVIGLIWISVNFYWLFFVNFSFFFFNKKKDSDQALALRSIRSSIDAYENDGYIDDENGERDADDQEVKHFIRLLLMSRRGHGKGNKMLRDGRWNIDE